MHLDVADNVICVIRAVPLVLLYFKAAILLRDDRISMLKDERVKIAGPLERLDLACTLRLHEAAVEKLSDNWSHRLDHLTGLLQI